MSDSKEKAIEDRDALLEMYKAGFLDGYKRLKRLRSKKEWDTMNKHYLQSFKKRFDKSIKLAFKKK